MQQKTNKSEVKQNTGRNVNWKPLNKLSNETKNKNLNKIPTYY